jgi:hypothetical protein
MNPRPDLLSLTPDDLAVLTNRGTVKRAQREVEAAEVTVEWEATDDGQVTANWSDAVVCEFPAGKTLHEAKCSCPAVELCRHLVRSVLAWQAHAVVLETVADAPAAAKAQPWNPGDITDEQIGAHAVKGLFIKARQRWEEGALVECLIGVKPSARFYDLGLSVRFPVPGDVRYAHCDCGQPAPCLHALLAVFAFRKLEQGKVAALVASGPVDNAQDEPLLVDAERVALDLLTDGIGGIPRSEADRWKRCATQLQAAGLVWLAGIVEDLLLERERYLGRDALFAPENVALLAGELLVRCDALRHATSLPRGLAGGWKSNEKTEVGYSRWIGLGTMVTQTRKSVRLSAMLQEADTGSLGAVEREVSDPTDGKLEAENFANLARVGMVKGAGIRALGSGQVLTESCRRTPDNRLTFGRARAQVSTQGFEWEKLRAPVLVEDFTELHSRLSLLPPRSLRPRRVGEDFHVLAVARNTEGKFDHATQTLTADLFDVNGQSITLRLPWTARGTTGFDRLTSALVENTTLFVSGSVTLTPAGLAILPAGVVFRGESRMLVQPWVDETSSAALLKHEDDSMISPAATSGVAIPDPWQELGRLLTDLMVSGSSKSGLQVDVWQRLEQDASIAGCQLAARLAGSVASARRAQLEGSNTKTHQLLAHALVAWRSAVDLI